MGEIRQVIAKKRPPQKQYFVYGCIFSLLAAIAVLAAGLYAERGAAFISVCAVLAVVIALFAAYSFAAYFLQKWLPAVLIYAEGENLYCYRYKKKEYLSLPLAEIASAVAGSSPRDVRAGTVLLKTVSGENIEVVEVEQPFAACEEILRRKAAPGGQTEGGEERCKYAQAGESARACGKAEEQKGDAP